MTLLTFWHCFSHWHSYQTALRQHWDSVFYHILYLNNSKNPQAKNSEKNMWFFRGHFGNLTHPVSLPSATGCSHAAHLKDKIVFYVRINRSSQQELYTHTNVLRRILEWTVITSPPPLLSWILLCLLPAAFQGSGDKNHKIIYNKCSFPSCAHAKNAKHN